jgi:hypothetical protein
MFASAKVFTLFRPADRMAVDNEKDRTVTGME